jgi:hypothetical protein
MPFVDPTNTWRVRSSKTIPTPEQTPTTLPYIILDAKLQKEGVASWIPFNQIVNINIVYIQTICQ